MTKATARISIAAVIVNLGIGNTAAVIVSGYNPRGAGNLACGRLFEPALLYRSGCSRARVQFDFMLFSRLAKGMPSRPDQAQFGHDAVCGFLLTGIFGYAKLALHAKPLHRSGLILSGKALTLFAIAGKTHSRASMKSTPVTERATAFI